MKSIFSDPQKHQRRSIRLKGYDYSQPGAYFVTLVTHRRVEIFGAVVNGEMKLSALGQIVHEEWMRSITLRREVRLYEDEFVIMPNHIHGIVWFVVGADGIRPADMANRVGADGVRPVYIGNGVRPLDGVPVDIREDACHAPQPPQPAPLERRPKSLGSFIAGFKAAVTSRAGRELKMSAIWQRNYYEHIIRNEREFLNIWNYIDRNPSKWQDDQLQPSALPNRFNQG